MEEFFKQFRDNLENRSEPNFEERDWQDMQVRLERKDTRPQNWAWWWMTMPFILLLTGSNAYLFWQWKKSDQKCAILESKRDTIFHTRLVHTRDTIFRSRVVYERGAGYELLSKQATEDVFAQKQGQGGAAQATLLTVNQHTQSVLQQNHNLYGKIDSIRTASMAGKENSFEPTVLDTTSLPITETKLLKAPSNAVRLQDYMVSSPLKNQRKKLLTRIYEFRPKGFQLGASGGWVYPLGKALDYQSGNSVGLQAVVECTPRIQLWTEFSYAKTRFLTRRMGDDIGVPMIDPPADDFVFSLAEVPQPVLQYSVGLQYRFRPQHRLRPLLGLGYAAVTMMPYDVTYEFKNPSLGVEWDYDQAEQGIGLLSNFGLFHIGLEYHLVKKWNLQFRANYRTGLEKTGIRPPDMLGIQGGINYLF